MLTLEIWISCSPRMGIISGSGLDILSGRQRVDWRVLFHGEQKLCIFGPQHLLIKSSTQAFQDSEPAIQPSLADRIHLKMVFLHGTPLYRQALHSLPVLNVLHDTTNGGITGRMMSLRYSQVTSWYKSWEKLLQTIQCAVGLGLPTW